jgi:pimeloyl-ACP methyl ester carboxylesterase
MTDNPRTYGRPPYRVAVLHGGPGAPGYMAPVARELCDAWGVLEPLQTEETLDGQVGELQAVLTGAGETPMVLIGSSWGAMLAVVLAARHPAAVRRLVLVGSGVFEERYAAAIQATRWSRLDEAGRREALAVAQALGDPGLPDADAAFARLGELSTRADAFDPLTLDTEVLAHQARIYLRVWPEMQALRRSGALLDLARSVRCPVTAIHGDYDSHPAEGVSRPLAAVLPDFRFILLARCGHLPWIERHARDEFFRLVRAELRLAYPSR